MSRPLITAKEFRSVPVRLVSAPPPSGQASSTMDIFVNPADADGPTLTPHTSQQVVRSVKQPAPQQSTEQPQPRLSSPARRGVPSLNLTPVGSAATGRAASAGRRPASPPLSGRRDFAPPRPVVIANLENFEEVREPVKTVLNSPRSLAACAELGIHPTELLARPVGDFLAPGVPEAVATIRFQHFETRRQAKLATLRAARAAKIEAQHHAQNAVKRATAGPGPTPASSSAAVPVSFARLKVEEENAKRRRQADLVRERAKLLDAQRERKIIEKQVSTARRVLDYRLDCEEDKLKVIELRRLRWADTREQMEHRRRAEEFRRQQRAQQNEERRKAFDKFNLAMARGQYLTPKAREERIRASSAQR